MTDIDNTIVENGTIFHVIGKKETENHIEVELQNVEDGEIETRLIHK